MRAEIFIFAELEKRKEEAAGPIRKKGEFNIKRLNCTMREPGAVIRRCSKERTERNRK